MTCVLLTVWAVPRNIAIALLKLYRKLISPLYGQVCRYHPSCSRYALESYQQSGVVMGTLQTMWRLLRCNPWSAGGIDDPPSRLRAPLELNRYGFVVCRAQRTGALPLQKGVIH